MSNWMFIIVLLGVAILVIGGFAIPMTRKQRALLKKYPGYPKGYFQSQAMGVGVAVGAGLGVAMDNIAIGVGIGVALGAAIGSRREAAHKNELRPLSDEEKALKRQKLVFAFSSLSIVMLIAVLIYFLNN